MTWLDFLALTLASGAVVHTWQHGSIFADWRAFIASDDSPATNQREAQETVAQANRQFADYTESQAASFPLSKWQQLYDQYAPRWLSELLSCSYCLSHHVPWILALLFFFPLQFVDLPWVVFLLKLPVYSLAATRLMYLIAERLSPE